MQKRNHFYGFSHMEASSRVYSYRTTPFALMHAFASTERAMSMKRLVSLCFALVLLLTDRASHAQVAAVPTLMNFQGRLARPDSTPVPNGTYTVTFRLFSVPTGGTALWSHTLPVTIRNGTF